MFGECIDFAPQPSGGRRGRQHHMLPVSQAEKPQLTPKEQANRLASQVGLDTKMLDGLAFELLQGVGPSELRRAMRNAVMALQQGKVVTVISTENLEDFLAGKIAMLPLSVRFPLMAEWGGAQHGADGKLPLTFEKPVRSRGTNVPSSQANFLSFDSLPGAGGSQQDRNSSGQKVDGAEEEARRKQKAKEKLLQKKRRQALSEAYAYQDQEDDTGWQHAVEYAQEQPQQPGAVQVSNAFLEEIQRRKGDQELQEKHASALQEQEAKRAVSKVLLNFEKTKAAVEEGLQAARQSVKLLSGPESTAKKGQDADNSNPDAPTNDIFREAEATTENTPQKAGSEQDQALLKKEVDEGGGSLEYRSEGRRDRRSGHTRGRRNSSAQDQEFIGGEDEDYECWRDTAQRGRRSDSRDFYRSERGHGRRGEGRTYEEQPPLHDRGDVYLAPRKERRHSHRYDDDVGRGYLRGDRHDRLCAASRSRSRPPNDGDYYEYERRADYHRRQQDSRSCDRQYNYSQEYRRGGARYQERFDSRGRGYEMPRERGNQYRRETGLHHRRADSRSPMLDGDGRNQRPRRRIEHDQRYAENSGRSYGRDQQEQEPLSRRPHGRRRRSDVEASDGRSRSREKFREKIQAPEKQKETPEKAVGRQFAEKPASTATQAPAGGDEKRGASKNAFSSSAGPAPPATTAVATVGATAKPAPALRQLACRNGWAEYVDQNTGEHVYKNVLTGEMTKRKPAEFGSLISDTMNQRRLAWLANQRATQQVGELQNLARMAGMAPGAGMAPMAGMPPMAGMTPAPM